MQKGSRNIIINNLDQKIKNLSQVLEAVFLDLQFQLSARSAITFKIKLPFPICPDSPLYYRKDFCSFPVHIGNIRHKETAQVLKFENQSFENFCLQTALELGVEPNIVRI